MKSAAVLKYVLTGDNLTPFTTSWSHRRILKPYVTVPIMSCQNHIVDLKWQNRLKVGTDKPKLKVKMQSVSDDDVRKRLLEKPRFELAAKGVFLLGRCKYVGLSPIIIMLVPAVRLSTVWMSRPYCRCCMYIYQFILLT